MKERRTEAKGTKTEEGGIEFPPPPPFTTQMSLHKSFDFLACAYLITASSTRASPAQGAGVRVRQREGEVEKG